MIEPTKEQLNELADKWLKGTLNAQEKEVLDQWYELDIEQTIPWSGKDLSEDELKARLLNNIQENKEITVRFKSHPAKRRWQWPAAAVIIMALSFGTYHYLSNSKQEQAAQEFAIQAQTLSPGGNRATLTLDDGSILDLSDHQNGIIINNETITYADGTQVIATENEGAVRQPISSPERQLALTTPIGGQYQITLSDGTKVWLNAGSTLKYPNHFAGKERIVELQGEAYFEVAQNKAKPFKVTSQGQEVEVLGTHFNISAYTNDKTIKTTLLEGSVKVSNGLSSSKEANDPRNTKILTPGQQAQVSNDNIVIATNIDLEGIISWKEGYFKFNENLESIMAKVARWYDIEVVYEIKPDPKLTFSGKISRDRNIAGILNMLSFNGDVHFKIEGRRVIVMK